MPSEQKPNKKARNTKKSTISKKVKTSKKRKPKKELSIPMIDELLQSPESIAVIDEVVAEVAAPITPVAAPAKKQRAKPVHYIDNAKLLAEMVKHRDAVAAYNLDPVNVTKPLVNNQIGTAILMIAERLATKPNFANYTYRDEMVSDGIENCLTYLHNFDPAKSKNPFAYLTQIIYYAFIRRITKEKKQSYIKMKLFQSMDKHGVIHEIIKSTDEESHANNVDGLANPYAGYCNLSQFDLEYFDKKTAKKEKKKREKTAKPDAEPEAKGLSDFLEEV